jgi:hypothetical protein
MFNSHNLNELEKPEEWDKHIKDHNETIVEISSQKFTLSHMSNKELTLHSDKYKQIFNILIKYNGADNWVTQNKKFKY